MPRQLWNPTFVKEVNWDEIQPLLTS